MDFSQFICAFAMNETIRKGGTSWECFPDGFVVMKGDASIDYSFACLDVKAEVEVPRLNLNAKCSLLFFPSKRGDNVVILMNDYLKTIIEADDSGTPILHLTKLDKSKILFADKYETGTYDLRYEGESSIQKEQDVVHHNCGNSQC
jgi:hypothetical protein